MHNKPHLEETKRKISEAKRGKHLSLETRMKMSNSRKGNKNPFYGKHHTEKTKEINRQAHSGKNSSNWKGGISKEVNYKREWGKTEKAKKWRKENKDKINFSNLRRCARRREAEGLHTFGEWETLKAQYDWTCPACKRKEPEIKLDHISPICYNESICHTKTHKKRKNTTNYITKIIKKSLDYLAENGERKIPKEQVLSVKNTEMPIRKRDMLFVKSGEQIILEKYENNIEKIPEFVLMAV